MVKEGQLLYEIDPRPYKASLDAAEAQKAGADAGLELAKTEYARAASLVKTNAVSQTELQVWKAKEGTAAAEVLRALAAIEQARLDLDFTKVVAPITGKVSRTQVDQRNLVNATGGETLLTTIVSVDPVYVYFNVDERSLLRYRESGQGRKDQQCADRVERSAYPRLRSPRRRTGVSSSGPRGCRRARRPSRRWRKSPAR